MTRLVQNVLILSLFLLFGILQDVVSAEKSDCLRYEGFSGGMMLHTGYVWAHGFDLRDDNGQLLQHVSLRGVPFGIGGAVRIHLGKHLRVGSEGYVSTLKYGIRGSFASVGWGGVLVDAYWELGRWLLFMGGTMGGGAQRTLTLTSNYTNDFTADRHVLYRKYGFAALVPFVGAEFVVTSKLHLTVKVDNVFNVSHVAPDFVTGPRVYFGFTFYHLKGHGD